MSTQKIDQPFKTEGGKFYTADWIVSLFPPKDKYHNFIDAMCRSCAVLLAHDATNCSEIANDLDREITTFWRVMKNRHQFEEFRGWVETTPFSSIEFEAALARKAPYDKTDDIAVAGRFFVLARMSRSGNLQDFATLTKNRLRRGMNEQVSAWLTSIVKLPEVHARMARVLLLDKDVFTLLAEWDQDGTVIYLDPPYLVEAGARVTKKLYGKFDWTPEQHAQLLQALLKIKKAYIVLSGYKTKLYEDALTPAAGWTLHTKEVPLHSAGGKAKRTQTECVWLNY